MGGLRLDLSKFYGNTKIGEENKGNVSNIKYSLNGGLEFNVKSSSLALRQE